MPKDLDLSPSLDESAFSSAHFEKALDVFTGAHTNADLVEEICHTLHSAGYDLNKTLIVTARGRKSSSYILMWFSLFSSPSY